jgi:beta-RFAP synthase
MTNTNVEIMNSSMSIHDKVSVITSARLHMGFFDLNGNLGRRFGSIGVGLQTPMTSLTVTPADRISVVSTLSVRSTPCPAAERVAKVAEQIMQSLALDGGVRIEVLDAIPEHSGLGSGTQLALAIGMAISHLYGLNLASKDIAVLTQRGMRSGVGLGTFVHGGLIIDGGRAPNSALPPVIAHADFPEDWPILLIFDRSHQGVHGTQEIAAFKELPEFPAESSAILCRHVLMQALPAIAERDLKSFGEAIQALQILTGDYFAPAQGGARYTSPLVAQVLTTMQQSGVHCFGQSSWGPTGFAVFENQAQAEMQLQQLRTKFGAESNLKFVLTKANNQASQIKVS